MNDLQEIPCHIAAIMDGNGRWAAERGLPRREGHRAGAESVRACVEACQELGVKWLTLYAFSSENWKRPATEVEALMLLLDKFLKDKTPELEERGVRLKAIGRLDMLPKRTRRHLEKTIERTADAKGMTLVLALSYGGREEIVDACKRIASQAKSGELEPEEIDNELFSENLYGPDIPDPDLLIRTSGEMRLSNFLLWQVSYSELVIVPKFWPDFDKTDLHDAVAEFTRRHRRFGKV